MSKNFNLKIICNNKIIYNNNTYKQIHIEGVNSCVRILGVGNRYEEKCDEWFNNSLKINCPYVIFTDKENIEYIKQFRRELPTIYIEYKIEDFQTYKDRMKTDPYHCPSVELNLIWNEKVFMVQKAAEMNPFNSEYFMWIDAGIYQYREILPPDQIYSNINTLKSLPIDKFIYSTSEAYNKDLIRIDNYYHHIAGGGWIMHKNMIDSYANLYDSYLDKLVDKNNIWTEQVIYTHICKDHEHLYYKLCDGYGEVVPYLYKQL